MKKYLKQSIALHVIFCILVLVDMSNIWKADVTLGETPIIVDLSEVKIDEMTNLPAKAELGDEDIKATVQEKSDREQYTTNSDIREEIVDDDKPDEVTQDFLEAPKPEKKPVDDKPKKEPDAKPVPNKVPPRPESKAKPKPKPKEKPKDKPKQIVKKEEPKQQKYVQSNALKSLLEEIDDSKNIDVGDVTQGAMVKADSDINNLGIEGGNSKGSYFSELTISETDAIASLLRSNWNLDPGAVGIKDMVVEIRLYLMPDGAIQKIEFLDMSRFNSDGAYRSVAESARRAIIATQPAFKEVFGVKYSNKYASWKTIKLSFDPLDKGIK